jgi:hypothetical protein
MKNATREIAKRKDKTTTTITTIPFHQPHTE